MMLEINYQIEKLNDHSFRMYSPAGVYMDLITGKDRALLIDTGYGMGDLPGTVRKITDLPLDIVNTHGHVDHACGNYQFDCPVYIHPDDMELCRFHTSRLQRTLAVEMVRNEEIIDSGILYTRNVELERYLESGSGELIPVKEGHIFDLGGIVLKVTELPGHTIGSIGLINEVDDLLYVGDAVGDATWLFLPEATDVAAYIDTLRKVQDIGCAGLVLSHRPGIVSSESVIDYIDAAENASSAYEDGVPFTAPLVPGATARICPRPGYTSDDMDKQGYACIITNKDHL